MIPPAPALSILILPPWSYIAAFASLRFNLLLLSINTLLKVEIPITLKVFALSSAVDAAPTVIVLVAPLPEATIPSPTKLSVVAVVDKALPSSWTLTPPPEPPPPETVLYETNSTISPTKQPTARTTELPFVAVNSLSVSLVPLMNTSRNPTLYVKLNVVCPADAVTVVVVLIVGNDAQATPLPVDLKYCPFNPLEPPKLNELLKLTLPLKSTLLLNVAAVPVII